MEVLLPQITGGAPRRGAGRGTPVHNISLGVNGLDVFIALGHKGNIQTRLVRNRLDWPIRESKTGPSRLHVDVYKTRFSPFSHVAWWWTGHGSRLSCAWPALWLPDLKTNTAS